MRAPVLNEENKTIGRWTPPDREWLVKQYLEDQKSTNRIAEETGADRSTVCSWLQRNRIHLRTIQQAGELRRRKKNKIRKGRFFGGEDVGAAAFRYRARKTLAESGTSKVCNWCGASGGRIEVNHRDHDYRNWRLSNLQYLCCRCHRLETILWNMRLEGALEVEASGDRMVLTFVKVGKHLGELT